MTITEAVSRRQRGLGGSRRTGWIGVDIGSCTIKIAQAERTSGRFRIARSVIVRAPDGKPYDRSGFEDGRVAEAIRDAISLHGGFIGRTAGCVVSMSHCELRTLISAKGSEDEQRDLISLELQQDSSCSPEPLEFDFWEGATNLDDEARGMIQVHVMSLPRSLADMIGTTLLDSGLTCSLLDTVPFCALRSLEMDGTSVADVTPKARTQALLDWGYSVATLVIVHDGRPILSRCLRDCGLSRLFAPIADRLKLTHTQTDALLLNCGIRRTGIQHRPEDELSDLIVELASPLLHDLIEELMQTLDFLRMQFGGRLPGQFVVSGGGGAIPGVAEQLEATLRIPVRGWQLPLHSADPEQPQPVLANATALSALAWES